MSGFNLNDTVGILVRVLQNHREIIDLWHKVSALLQKIGLMPANAAPQKATHDFDVKWVQESLNTLGANPKLKVDGHMGPQTFNAVLQYQQQHKDLEADGWVGMLTLAALETDLAKRAGTGSR